jgi:hypothetical protein
VAASLYQSRNTTIADCLVVNIAGSAKEKPFQLLSMHTSHHPDAIAVSAFVGNSIVDSYMDRSVQHAWMTSSGHTQPKAGTGIPLMVAE